MEQPTWYRALPDWARALVLLVLAVVGLKLLGVIAVLLFLAFVTAAAFGSTTGLVAVSLLALAVLLVPTVAAALYVRTGDDDSDDPTDRVRRQYVEGEIDEGTLERALEEQLEADRPADRRSSDGSRRGSYERERERELD